MKRFFLIGCLVIAAGLGAEEAAASWTSPVSEIRMRCPICNGKGAYKARPPDLDQHRGTMDSKEHWDIKVKRCPCCDGKGVRTVYDLERVPPKPDVIPCRLCGWSGIRMCTKCTATGFMKCPNKKCENGWIITKPKRKSSHRQASSVTICPDCQGKGKVPCMACLGKRAVLCPRCNGAGRDLERERQEREKQAKNAARAEKEKQRAAERAERERKRSEQKGAQ